MAVQSVPFTPRPSSPSQGRILDWDVAPLPVRRISAADLAEALRQGTEDFWAKPSHVLFLALIYPVAGLVLARLIVGYDILPLLFPLAAGFALVGPFAAVGLYEISRRRENGLDTSWNHAIDVVHAPGFGAILALGLVLLAIFFAWLLVAWLVYALTIGPELPETMGSFLSDVFQTPQGIAMILIGNGIGFLFALLVLTISVVSFPLMLERHVGMISAVRTSLDAMRANPVTLLGWGAIVAAALVIGLAPLFVGLALVLPILGHATWHLYRKVVA